MSEQKYSVLMSVYHKEKPAYLKESLHSMLNQSVPPDEIILVKDGPLTAALDDAIAEYAHRENFKVIALPENLGLGKALNIGLQNCKHELVARMDTDDISKKNRCETQIKMLEDNKISVVGSAVEEFMDDDENFIAFRTVVEDSKAISRYMKYRNPMNHPTVMFRKKVIEAVGGYQDCYLHEDYFLWIRLLEKGFLFKNINQPLVKMRVTDETYKRRGGFKYFCTQKRMYDYMLQNKIINIREYFMNNFVRFVFRVLIPNSLRKFLYLRFLRKRGANKNE